MVSCRELSESHRNPHRYRCIRTVLGKIVCRSCALLGCHRDTRCEVVSDKEETAKKMIQDVDRARDAYHVRYAGYIPSDFSHTDIMIDSSCLGVDGTATYLCDFVNAKVSIR